MKRVTLASLLAAVAGVFALAIAVEEIPRLAFPWDLRIFSEATFLTDMLKLHAGQSPYTNPTDCNSFIYAPALDYITFAVLRPFGMDLDIRACRAVCFLIGVGGAVLIGRGAATFARLLCGEARVSRTVWFVATVLAIGIFSRSYTSDACHPDNLYMLHAATLFTLTVIAANSGRFAHALVAVAFGALAITIKQTAAMGAIGATLLLFYVHGRTWKIARCAALIVWGGVWGLLGAYVLLRGWGKFWTLTVPGSQPVEWYRLYRLLQTYTVQMSFRPMLAAAFVPSCVYIAFAARKNEELRKLCLAWLAIGATEVITSLVSYFKAWGFWNNVTIVDLWMLMPIVGVAWYAMRPGDDLTHARRSVAAGYFFTLFLAETPTRVWPTHDEYVVGRALDASVAEDHAAGKRVLTSMGVSTLIHNGMTDVVLDRHNSAAELVVAKMESRAGAKARFAQRYYDKIYIVVTAAYDEDVTKTILANYHETAFIPPAPPPPNTDWDYLGNMWFLKDGIRVYEPNL